MKDFFNTAKRRLGIDIQKEKYAYDLDEQFGYMAKAKIPDRWVATTCGYCSVGCGMFIGVKKGKPVSVRGNPDHPVNEGRLCPKGLAEHYAITAPNRAKWPLWKVKKGKFQRVPWSWAIRTLVEKFQAVQNRYGAEAVGVISTGQLVTEEFYALGKLIRLGFRAKHFDGNTTLCMASAVSGYKRSFGSDGPPGNYEDLEKADLVFLIGANIADNHPILCYRLEKNHDKTLIVADPRVTKTAMMADIFLPVKPRSDIALLNAMMHVIIKEGKVNREYIRNHTTGFEELSKHLEKYTPEYVSGITGLPAGQIRKVADLYARAKAPFIGWTMGVNHSTQGTETVNAICNLALITGNVGRVGASPFSITGQCNAMGTRESGFASSLPGYRKFENENHRKELAALWGIEEEIIPTARGLAYPDIIEGVLRGKIKALWIIATNPLVSFPNQNYLLQALEGLEFLVVQDGYHPIPTSEVADLVLPAAVWGEKEGTYTNSERRVSKVNKAVDPPGEAKSDFEIFLAIAKELGVYERLFPGWTEPKNAFEEWKKVSRGRLCDYSGLDYEMIERFGGVQWPFTENGKRDPRESFPLYQDGIFQTDDGRAKLWVVENEAPPEVPDQSFPFWLNTGRTVEHWHTRTKTGQIDLLNRLSPEAWVEMNPRDAQKLKLEHGDYVRVASRRGSIERVVLRVTETVAPGQIFIPFHYAEANANNLTVNVADPISREPNYKQAAVRIEKCLAVVALLLICGMCLPSSSQAAQQPENDRLKAKVGGQSRYRFEYRDDLNLNDQTYEDDAMHLIRNRLNLNLAYLSETGGTPARFFVEGQEAHAFTESDVNQTNVFVNEVDLRQAFVELKSPWKKAPVTAKVGRQVLSYGDERFVGPLDWTNTARVFDALKLIYTPHAQFQLDVFASRVVRVEKEKWDTTPHNDNFYGVYTTLKPFRKKMDQILDTFLFIRHNTDVSASGERRRGELKEYTFGNRFKGKKGNWDYGTEYAVQLGSRAHDEIQAWAFHQELGYTFSKTPWTSRLYGEYNHASGDRNPVDGKFQTFDNLYPTNHNKYGYIDLVSLKNINDFMVGASVKPHARLFFSADFHWFILDAKESAWFNVAGAGGTVRAANANADTHLGNEIDLFATYKLTERLGLLGGYSRFFAGPFAKDTGAHDDANFFYLQTIFNI